MASVLGRAEGQKLIERAADRVGVFDDLLFGEHLAHLVLAGRIAHARRAAAEQIRSACRRLAAGGAKSVH
jgi:hypothetical protein